MSRYFIQGETLTNIADKIRELSGTTGSLDLNTIISHMGNSNTEIDEQTDIIIEIMAALENKTAVSQPSLPTLTNEGSAADMLSGKQLINSNNEVVTGTIATKTSSNLTTSGATVTVPAGYYASNASKSVSTATQATPSITVSSSGLITASATQSAGYVSAGTKSATKQLTVQAAQTITPGTSDQTIASGQYLTGIQTIKGDTNLVARNIKSGVSIFGVAGNYECEDSSSGGDSSSGSATPCTVTVTFSWKYITTVGSMYRYAPQLVCITFLDPEGVLQNITYNIKTISSSTAPADTVYTFTTLPNQTFMVQIYNDVYTGAGSGGVSLLGQCGNSQYSTGEVFLVTADGSVVFGAKDLEEELIPDDIL